MKKLSLFVALMIAFSPKALAASKCSYDEQIALNQKAANIRHNYVIAEKTVEFEDGEEDVDYIKINILNLSEEFYAVVTNSANDDVQRINYSDTVNGDAFIEWNDFDEVTSFVIKIYSSSKTSCPDEEYKTLYLTTPRYNIYCTMGICQSAKDFSLCQKFTTAEEVSVDDFLRRTRAYLDGKVDKDENPVDEEKDTIFDNILSFLGKYKWYILGGVVVIGGTVGVVYLIKAKKQRELGL